MSEPERKDISSTGSSSESESEEIESERQNETRVTNLDWCPCGNCKNEKRETDCLCCQKIDAVNGIFPNKQVKCVLMCEEFQTLCLDKVILNNGLTGLHETRGDPIEDNFPNRSLRYATYKEFMWWVFKKLRKGNRRLIPLCALWKIRELYPEADENYVMYLEGKQD